MARRKATPAKGREKVKSEMPVVVEDAPMASTNDTMIATTKWDTLFHKIYTVSGAIFFLLWILIGLFVALVIVQGLRKGVYSGLLSASTASQTTSSTDTQAPTEAPLPGIGTVNIACVQQALSPESLQKVIQEKKIDVLQGEERTKFEACIVKREEASPTASANP